MVALILTASVAVCGGAACSRSTSPSSTRSTSGDAAAAAAAFPCADSTGPDTVVLLRDKGAAIDGMILGRAGPAVVLANQLEDDLCRWILEAQLLVRQGYRAVLFNYTVTHPADEDVRAAVQAARERGATQVFLMGASKGGTSVLVAAATAAPPVNGVISLSAPASMYNLDGLAAVAKLSAPALFLAGRTDEPFADDAGKLYAACTSKDKAIEIQETSAHGVALLDQHVRDLVMAFLSGHR
jgi:alpha/beta superfamily hydrolase